MPFRLMCSLKTNHRILIFAPGSLGDTLLISPAIFLIKAIHDGQPVDLLYDFPQGRSKMTPREILSESGVIDRFIGYPVRSSGQKFFDITSVVRLWLVLFMRYSTVYYLPEAWEQEARLTRDKLFFRLCLIRNIKGFNRIRSIPNAFNRTESRTIEVLDRTEIQISKAQFGMLVSPHFIRLRLNVLPSELNVKFKKNFFIISPFSNMESKNWALENYEKICLELIQDMGLSPLVMGTVEDKEPANEFVNKLGAGTVICDLTSIGEIFHYVAGCRFYLGNDSGLMHVAAIAGLTCFSVFSERDFRGRWEPLGDGHFNYRSSLPCACCLSKVCPLSGDDHNRCLKEIKWEIVLRDLKGYLNE